MSLIRLLTYFVVGYLFWKFLKWLVAPAKKRGDSSGGNPGGKAMLLIKCNACGMFITESRALMVRGRAYCSTACAGTAANRA